MLVTRVYGDITFRTIIEEMSRLVKTKMGDRLGTPTTVSFNVRIVK